MRSVQRLPEVLLSHGTAASYSGVGPAAAAEPSGRQHTHASSLAQSRSFQRPRLPPRGVAHTEAHSSPAQSLGCPGSQFLYAPASHATSDHASKRSVRGERYSPSHAAVLPLA